MSRFPHRTHPSPAAQPIATLNGGAGSPALHPASAHPLADLLRGLLEALGQATWRLGETGVAPEMIPSGQEPGEGGTAGVRSVPSAPMAVRQKGEPRGHLCGALPLQEPGPQAGPWAPCVPASYSECAFGLITSGVFHKEKHWTFCPRLSDSLAVLRNVLRVSMWVCACIHQPQAPSPHLPTERGRVSMLAEVPPPRRQSWPSQVFCPHGWPPWTRLGRRQPPWASSRLRALRPAYSRVCVAGDSGSAAHQFRAHRAASGLANPAPPPTGRATGQGPATSLGLSVLISRMRVVTSPGRALPS